MANAVQIIFGANSTQFQTELAKMEARTMATSRRMSSIGGVGGHSGGAGIARESAVIAREASRGNFTKMAGSLSILIGYLNGAAGAAAAAVLPARLLATAYDAAAMKANVAAVAAMRKAEASAAAAEMEGFETEATIAAADADAVRAAQANATALALDRKAASAAADAVAAEASTGAAVAGVGAMAMATAVIGGLVATAVLWHMRIGMLASRLEGLKAPDVNLEPIVRQNHSINEATESQKKINSEIQTTIEKYNSAAAAAERIAKHTERQFVHAKKMNDLQKETELANLGNNATPEAKAAIERKYSDKELALQHQKNQREIANLIDERSNLTIEGTSAKRQADAIRVPSAKEDQQTESIAKGKADYAQKYLKTQKEDPSLWESAKTQFAAGLNPGARDAIAAASKMNEDTAREWIANYKKTVQTNADNEEVRKRQEELNKKAGESLSKAAQIGLELPAKRAILSQDEADAKAEADAKLNADRVKSDLEKGQNAHGYALNSQQKIGAYAATSPPVLMQQLIALRQLVANTAPHSVSNHPPGPRHPQLGTHPGQKNLVNNVKSTF